MNCVTEYERLNYYYLSLLFLIMSSVQFRCILWYYSIGRRCPLTYVSTAAYARQPSWPTAILPLTGDPSTDQSARSVWRPSTANRLLQDIRVSSMTAFPLTPVNTARKHFPIRMHLRCTQESTPARNRLNVAGVTRSSARRRRWLATSLANIQWSSTHCSSRPYQPYYYYALEPLVIKCSLNVPWLTELLNIGVSEWSGVVIRNCFMHL